MGTEDLAINVVVAETTPPTPEPPKVGAVQEFLQGKKTIILALCGMIGGIPMWLGDQITGQELIAMEFLAALHLLQRLGTIKTHNVLLDALEKLADSRSGGRVLLALIFAGFACVAGCGYHIVGYDPEQVASQADEMNTSWTWYSTHSVCKNADDERQIGPAYRMAFGNNLAGIARILRGNGDPALSGTTQTAVISEGGR